MMVPLLVFALLFAGCYAQAPAWAITGCTFTSNTLVVGIPYNCTATMYTAPAQGMQPTLTVVPNPIDAISVNGLSSASLVFTNTVTSVNFTLQGAALGSVSVALTSSNTTLYPSPASLTLQVIPRQLDLTKGYINVFPATNNIVGVPSSSFAAGLAIYPQSGQSVTFTPNSEGNSVVFTPASLQFFSTPTDIVFNYQIQNPGSNLVWWTVSGPASSLYSPPPNVTLYAQTRAITCTTFVASVVVGTESNVIRCNANYPPTESISVTVQSSLGVTFTPKMIVLSAAAPTAQLYFVAENPGPISITFQSSSTWYTAPPAQAVSITLKTFETSFTTLAPMAPGVISPVYTITTDYAPESDVTIQLTGTTGITLYPNSLTFTSTVASGSFQFSASGIQSGTISFSLSGTNYQNYVTPAPVSFTVSNMNVTIPSLGSITCGDTQTYTASVSSPPPLGFTIQPFANGATFNPPSWNFVNPNTSIPFQITGNYPGTSTVNFVVTGLDSMLVNNVAGTSFQITQKTITAPTYTPLLPGVAAPFVITLSAPPTSDLTITPSAPGVTFTPNSFVFNTNTLLSVSFTVTPSTAGNVMVVYSITGTDAGCYNSLAPTTMSVGPLSTTLTPGNMVAVPVGIESSPYTLTIQNLNQPVTITPWGSGLTFTPASVTLTPSVWSAYFAVTGSILGTQIVNYNMTGPAVSTGAVASIAPSSILIQPRQFNLPASFPDVYVNVPTDPLTVAVAYAPINGISLRMWAPDTVFTPETLTFTPGQTSQSFTYYSIVGNNPTKVVTFFLDGPDQPLYSMPAPLSFATHLRPLTGSTPIAPTYNVPFVFTVNTPFLPPNGLTITPVGAFSVSPQSAQITPGGPGAVSFTAIPTDIGVTPLKLLVAGDTTLYSLPADIAVTTQQATFQVDPPATGTLNLVFGEPSAPFYVYCNAPPATSVTLTLSSPQVTITPNVLTFTPSSLVASFVITADDSVFGIIAGGGTVNFAYTVSGPNAANFVMGNQNVSVKVQAPFRRIAVAPATLALYPEQPATFTVSLVDYPFNNVTVTPTIENSLYVSVSPASAMLTSETPNAVFSVVSQYAFSNPGQIDFTVSGSDAYFYKDSAAGLQLSVTYAAGAITTNIPTTPLKAGQTTVVEFMDVAGLSPLLNQTLIVQPYVISGPAVAFNPTELTFSSSSLSARYSMTPSAPGVVTLGFNMAGPQASLFSISGATTVTVAGLNFLGVSSAMFTAADQLVVGVTSRTFTVNTDYLTPNGVTLTPISPELTFTPSSFVFTNTSGVVSFTVVPNVLSRQSTVSVAFSVSGPDAGLFTVPANFLTAINPRTLTLSAPTLYGGIASQITLSALYPPPNGVTFTPVANGIVFQPASVSLTPSMSSVSFTATPVASGITTVPVSMSISGTDAGLYASPAATTLSVSWGAITVSPALGPGYQLSDTIILTPAPPVEVTVTPVAAGVIFTPASLTFNAGISRLSYTAVSGTAGPTQITYSLSGRGAALYRLTSSTQSTTATFVPLVLSAATADSTSSVYVAGSTSQPIVISSQYVSGSTATPVIPTGEVIITPNANFADAVFTPASVTITAPYNTATFTVTTSTPGTLVVGFSISGSGAANYAPMSSVSLSVSLRSFDIDPKLFVNSEYNPSTSVYFYGVESEMYTIFARSVPSSVILTPTSSNFAFNPSSLYFDPNTTSASFTMTGTQVGPAVISFLVNGTGAPAFNIPAPHTYTRVTYNVNFPAVPALSVGVKSDVQKVTISPTPVQPFIISLPAPNANIVYSPSQLVFTAGSPSAEFTAIAYATTIIESGPSIPGQVQPVKTSLNPIVLMGRDSGDFYTYQIPLATASSVNVVPGVFILHHPRYQMDVSSHVEVEISVVPRSDIVLTLYGNNMAFEPAHVTFVAGGDTKQNVKVTPLSATSHEIETDFKINYVCSGTNANDYMCPAETYHYVALPRSYVAAAVLVPLFVIACCIIAFIIYRRRQRKAGTVQLGNFAEKSANRRSYQSFDDVDVRPRGRTTTTTIVPSSPVPSSSTSVYVAPVVYTEPAAASNSENAPLVDSAV